MDMKSKQQNGFSLIELLLVVTIIGIISAVAIPNLAKGKRSADASAAFSSMKSAHTFQVGYFSTNNRFANITELSAAMSGGLGPITGTTTYKNRFTFQFTPASPTNAQLATGYTLSATRDTSYGDPALVFTVTQKGEISNPPF